MEEDSRPSNLAKRAVDLTEEANEEDFQTPPPILDDQQVCEEGGGAATQGDEDTIHGEYNEMLDVKDFYGDMPDP